MNDFSIVTREGHVSENFQGAILEILREVTIMRLCSNASASMTARRSTKVIQLTEKSLLRARM